ncbi:hypothetical protein SBC1_68250 (plasmid) [Caballeronia sp. SBC1]|uniref:hypothetical protein n=1 Tax=unclassified Caballeronia TaxID=2646786 RepID=UPI0013E1868B|nr:MULTISPECIES: hypothetical protein [unclassified Caballeronia]QIE28723.1 hypothetical protein SBC2_67990 [Caballeronia sp. SBC2]QIN66778.1 hypothetical protein SBC1_68250 [Caballeronia sp. SBC1]
MPVSMDSPPVAGDIEDIATHAPPVVERVQQQIDNSFTLLVIELIHTVQGFAPPAATGLHVVAGHRASLHCAARHGCVPRSRPAVDARFPCARNLTAQLPG